MLQKLFNSLQKTRDKFLGALRSILPAGKKLTEEDTELLEEILISADVGVEATTEIIDELRERLKRGDLSGADAIKFLEEHLLDLLGEPSPLRLFGKPHVMLIVGVNGTGKTTTIGKLAHRFRSSGSRVLVAAADTFRAAAGEQLAAWAERAGADIVSGQPGADPAAVVFDAIQKAKARGYDVVIADTAGRLHTKKNLMEELRKIVRVAGKAADGAPHDSLLVIDATTGQNGLTQAEVFHQAISLTGIILTKLDSTARGGIAVAIKKKLGLPIRAVGTGEGIEDIEDFVPEEYVRALISPVDADVE